MGHINRKLTAKFHRIIILAGIFHQCFEKFACKRHVADKIGVAKKNVMRPLLNTMVHLGQNLLHGFDARHTAVHYNNIAKFTLKRASAAGLKANNIVSFIANEIVTGNGTGF